MNRQNFPVYFLIGLALAFFLSVNNFAQKNYYPNEGDSWERRTPEQAKMDGAKLKEAIDFAIANESKSPRNLEFPETFGLDAEGNASTDIYKSMSLSELHEVLEKAVQDEDYEKAAKIRDEISKRES